MATTNRDAECIVETIFDKLVPGDETNIGCYSDATESYDKGLLGIGYVAPRICVKAIMKYVTKNSDMQALDICTGTGLASEALIAHGFTGPIDGIDGNEDMLKVARSKNIFRNLMNHKITPSTKMPVADNVYDIAICTGSFSPGHIRPECIPEFFRVLKPGGVLAFNTTNFRSDDKQVRDEDMDKPAAILRDLVAKGTCEQMEEGIYDGYEVSEKFKYYKGRKDKLHCYRKTRSIAE